MPARFAIQLRTRVRHTWIRAAVDIEVVNGEPHMRVLTLAGEGGEPLSAAVLSKLSLTDILHRAVQQKALEITPVHWEPSGPEPITWGAFKAQLISAIEADERAALTAARSATNRRRVTPDLLRRVLAVYEAKGVDGIIDDLGYSERNARRLLARARKEIQQ